jgi:uncharacterized repeat protein (TIGR01451 family)
MNRSGSHKHQSAPGRFSRFWNIDFERNRSTQLETKMNGHSTRTSWQEALGGAMLATFLLVAGMIFMLAAQVAHAAPAAGTVIGNQATASYQDAGGVARSATSNLVQTTVSQVKSFTLTAPGAVTVSPGQTVYYPHTVTNTGNGTDTYTLNAPVSSNFAATGTPHGGLVYYIDANGDGVPDNFTPIVSSGPIAAGGLFRFVVAGTVPAGAAAGNTATITVSVSDTVVTTSTNIDTTTVANSSIQVTKSMSASSGPSPFTPITVTLSYTNSGTLAATNIELRDVIPAGMTYIAGSGRWSVSGTTALTDAAGGDPAGIAYDFGATVAGRVTAIVANVNGGVSGTLTFQVGVNASLAPQTILNTAQFLTTTQAVANTNTASYQVLQAASVVADDNPLQAGDVALDDVVTVPSASPGSTIVFNNRIHNTGNGTDSFDIVLSGQASWPAGTTFSLFQSDGVTSLIDTNGNGTPDTGPVAAGATYTVVVKVTLPAVAAGGPFNLTKTAASRFNPAVSDTVTDRLVAITANTVDVTNNTARADSLPPGTANGGNAATTGFATTGAAVITTNLVTPNPSTSTVTRFQVYVNNTSTISDSYTMAAAGVPAGWTVVFRADGGGGTCAAVGAALPNTGTINAGANRLVCAEVTVPTTVSGQAAVGNYDLTISATSAVNPLVTDSKVDRVTVNAVHNVTLSPNNTQQTFPGGSVTYSHTISNTGNVVENVTYAAGCLTDSRSAQGWTSASYIDSNGNGTLEIGTDTLIVCGTTSNALNVGQSRTIFVRVFAPGSAVGADPANVTTVTATYNTGASTTFATDSTTVTDGLTLAKEQAPVACAAAGPHAGYTAAAIPAGPSTAPNQCIAYRIIATNTTAQTINLVVINDIVPANTKMNYACSGNGLATPSVSVGSIAGSTPGNNLTGTVSANVGTLTSTQSATLFFCVRIDP